ncbi:MAG: bifunctional DNA-formamidopyrimidine glycosylase/DNA-(apurinic or apyrimidinic site) lyase, partial [Sedimentisphaerales bacterium]|nr:bifunctional DNA-formamidopyrimidine glycosylase/DNA-(apurinic or apyrimidinic site) lyase [Sedimentisphaerales bacterium]
TPEAFIKKIRNTTLEHFGRRGKAIVISLKPKGYLIIQPKMSGYLMFGKKASNLEITSATKAVFRLSNDAVLHYNDHRMFGWLYYVEDLKAVKYFQNLGPEPLEKNFTVDLLKASLSRRVSPIKVVLMNQAVVAGIGNIYASEILFDVKIDPRRKATSLKAAEMKKLHASIQKTLRVAIEARGSSLRDYRDTSGQKGNFVQLIKVYNRAGKSCPRCKGVIQKIVQAQRSTFSCPHCQT